MIFLGRSYLAIFILVFSLTGIIANIHPVYGAKVWTFKHLVMSRYTKFIILFSEPILNLKFYYYITFTILNAQKH